MSLRGVVCGIGIGFGCVSMAPGQDLVRREGAGERREALNAMELRPFPNELWGQLTSWTGGNPVTPDAIRGKVVVLFTWSSWYKPSQVTLGQLQALAQSQAADVIVVGVHNPEGWDGAAPVLSERRITFPVAHDHEGKVRTALRVDQDPDVYVIDRAGNLRYADIENASVPAAVESLVKETAEEAAAVPTRLAESEAQAKQDAARTRPVTSKLLPGQALDLPFERPPAPEYAKANWPSKNEDNVDANDIQGQAFPGLSTETWLTPKPPTSGRVGIVYFWAPSNDESMAGLLILDAVKKLGLDDCAVIALSGQRPEGTPDNIGAVRSVLASRRPDIGHAHDPGQKLAQAVNIRRLPYAIVYSTDGVVRWQGPVSARDGTATEFRNAVRTILRVDPGLAARRKAEDEYRKSQAK